MGLTQKKKDLNPPNLGSCKTDFALRNFTIWNCQETVVNLAKDCFSLCKSRPMDIEFIDRASGKMVKETPPGESLLNFLYNKPVGKLALEVLVKRKFISTWYGKFMDSKRSLKKVPDFVKDLQIDMSESVKQIGEFTSFNDFFYRKLKPSARPIGKEIVSPGDGKILAFSNASEVNSFYIKGAEFTLPPFIQVAPLINKYQDAGMIILRLAPNDYHRYHFPYKGLALEPIKVSGPLYSVSPYALVENFTKVFVENKRELTELSTEDKGDMLIMPVGATMVGSIVQSYKGDSMVDKGAEMGYFAFGGSTIVILFEAGKVQIDADLLENTAKGMETGVKMGEKIAE